jgi:iron complex outermembrane recepter protein
MQTAEAQNVAQTATEQAPREVETVIVTGSNIRRTNAETFVPITVLDERAIEVRLGSSGARGDNANLNLRNMGATAT